MALLTEEEIVLQNEAEMVKDKAYAPYSKFKVGAALVTESGELFTGCNVENASYGLTICAEQNAITNGVSKLGNSFSIRTLVVTGDTDDPLPPCGACRQVIAEFSSPNTTVIACSKNGTFKKFTVKDLLPSSFSLNED